MTTKEYINAPATTKYKLQAHEHTNHLVAIAKLLFGSSCAPAVDARPMSSPLYDYYPVRVTVGGTSYVLNPEFYCSIDYKKVNCKHQETIEFYVDRLG
jgi:hypothetical protein